MENIIRCSNFNRIKKIVRNLKFNWMKIEQEKGITISTLVI
ncbi:MAG: hypothetical protein ACP2W7_02295 [Buchnera aphidicola (Tetraneura sorini)]